MRILEGHNHAGPSFVGVGHGIRAATRSLGAQLYAATILSDAATSIALTGDVTQNGTAFDFGGTATSRVTYEGLSLPAGTWWAHGVITDAEPGSARVRGLSPSYDPLGLRARGFHQVYRLPDLEGSGSVDFLASSNFDSTLESLVLVDQTTPLAQPWDIWVLAGQSNMAASTRCLPLDKDEDGWTDQRLLYVPGATNTGTVGAEQDVIDAMRGPLVMNAISGGAYVTDPAMIGVSPGIRFGQDLIKSMTVDRSLCLVAAAISGTGLEGTGAAWNPDGSTGDGALAYDNMIARVNAALAAAPVGSRLRGVIWAQGENDTSADMSSYPAAFAAMRARAETAWGRGQLPWFILLPPPDASRPNQDEFLRVQRAMATGSGGPEEQPLCYTVERPAGYMEDQTHVTAAGQRLAGAALAARAMALGLVDQGQDAPIDFDVALASQQVVTTIDPSDEPMPIDINGTLYTQRITDGVLLTPNMIIAAPTPLSRPTISGTAEVGQEQSGAPGLIEYAGEDPADWAFQWQRDGVDIPGATGLSYTPVIADSGVALTLVQTFGGVSVTSLPVAIAVLPVPTLVAEDFAAITDAEQNGATTDPLELTLDVGAAQAGKTTLLLSSIRFRNGTDDPSMIHVGTGAPATRIDPGAVGFAQQCRGWEIDTSALSGPQTFRVTFPNGERRQASIAAFSMLNANTFAAVGDVASGETSETIAIPQGGAMFGAAFNIWNGTPITWAGAVKRYEQNINSTVYFSSVAYQFNLDAEAARTVTATNTNNSGQVMALIAVGA